MRRGNAYVTGQYEGVYFIAYEDLHIYRNFKKLELEPRFLREMSVDELMGDWECDKFLSVENTKTVLDSFMKAFTQKFHSFYRAEPNEWLTQTKRIILKSGLFYICVEDGEWGLAVELIQKKGESISGFQKHRFEDYMSAIKNTLYDFVPYVYYRTSAWASALATRGGGMY